MDNRGYWHNVGNSGIESHRDKLAPEVDQARSNARDRYVFSCEIGEGVEIAKSDGTGILARFISAEKNRVTLRPEGAMVPLGFAEQVYLRRVNGDEVPAQFWEHKDGKIILRTLPVGD